MPEEPAQDRMHFAALRYAEDLLITLKGLGDHLRRIYAKYADTERMIHRKDANGKPMQRSVRIMTLSAWTKFAKEHQLLQADGTLMEARIASLCFSLSRMVREFDGDPSMEKPGLTYCDFLEALCRVADCIGLPTAAELDDAETRAQASRKATMKITVASVLDDLSRESSKDNAPLSEKLRVLVRHLLEAETARQRSSKLGTKRTSTAARRR